MLFVQLLGASLAQDRGRMDVQLEAQKKEIEGLQAKLMVWFPSRNLFFKSGNIQPAKRHWKWEKQRPGTML